MIRKVEKEENAADVECSFVFFGAFNMEMGMSLEHRLRLARRYE